jgi:hypothetical protein
VQNRCCDAAGTELCQCEEERWIGVEDRLPKQGVQSLWYDAIAGSAVVAKLDGDGLDWGGDLSMPLARCSHWMALPSAPNRQRKGLAGAGP